MSETIAQPGEAGRERAGWRAGEAFPAGRYALWLLLCVAGITGIRLAALHFSRTELFFDEAQYWFWSRELAFGYYSKPPLIGWIIRGATELCGMGEACIRAPSALIHGATAMLVYAIGRALYDERVGFWSGLLYATLPGVSLSSGLISTDVPLLFCTALALYALVQMRASPSWVWSVVLGLAIGLGLNAKYAMSYFLLSLGVYALATRTGRSLLRDIRLYGALGIAAAMIAPNLWWNAQNKFATFAHTADNANWSGSFLHLDNALEFVGGQFAVFGPILFAGLLILVLRWRRAATLTGNTDAERLLFCFCLPVLAAILLQALISRAHANWAAFAYIAATVLVTAAFLHAGAKRLLRASLALHVAIMLLVAVGGAFAGRFVLPGGADPYARVLGWRAMAEAAAAKAKAEGYRAIATDRRALAAELLYYLRDRDIPVVALRGDGRPRDHFELTRPLTEQTPRPVLVVTQGRARMGDAQAQTIEIVAGGERRAVTFHRMGHEKP